MINLGNCVWSSAYCLIRSSTRDSVGNSIGILVNNSVEYFVFSPTWRSVRSKNSVVSSVYYSVRKSVREAEIKYAY